MKFRSIWQVSIKCPSILIWSIHQVSEYPNIRWVYLDTGTSSLLKCLCNIDPQYYWIRVLLYHKNRVPVQHRPTQLTVRDRYQLSMIKKSWTVFQIYLGCVPVAFFQIALELWSTCTLAHLKQTCTIPPCNFWPLLVVNLVIDYAAYDLNMVLLALRLYIIMVEGSELLRDWLLN